VDPGDCRAVSTPSRRSYGLLLATTALAVFNPKGGVTASFFDAALTIFDNQTRGGRIFFDGGYNDPISKWTGRLQLSARDIAKSVKDKGKGK
jgi:hypothetical protein